MTSKSNCCGAKLEMNGYGAVSCSICGKPCSVEQEKVEAVRALLRKVTEVYSEFGDSESTFETYLGIKTQDLISLLSPTLPSEQELLTDEEIELAYQHNAMTCSHKQALRYVAKAQLAKVKQATEG